MALTKVVALLMLTALVSGSALPVFAPGNQTKAMMFIQTAEKAEEIALELIERAQSSGTDVSTALSLIDEGNILLAQAKVAYDEDDYDSAATDAIIAQIRFRDALKTLAPERASMEGEDMARLHEAIERARERIQRIVEVLSSTDVGEELRDQIRTKLSQAESLLKETESILESDVGNVSEAAGKMAQAEKLITEAFAMLKLASSVPDIHQIEALLRNTEKEIQRLRNDLEKMAGKNIRVDDLGSLLDTAESLLKTAQGKASSEDLDGALSDIDQARNIMEQVRKEMSKRQRQGP